LGRIIIAVDLEMESCVGVNDVPRDLMCVCAVTCVSWKCLGGCPCC
jgi:hypothetical protein